VPSNSTPVPTLRRAVLGVVAGWVLCALAGLAALVALAVAPAGAQRAGDHWGGLVPGLKSRLAANPDPEVTLQLAMVYAHEGLLLDGWRALKQVDQMIGGAGHREDFGRRASARASAEVQRDPGNLLARYELAFASSFVEPDHQTAYREFLEISRQDPHNAMNHGYLGYIYAERKDAGNTIAQWEEAVRLDPSNNVLHYMLGMAYSHVSRSRDAAVQFALAYRDRTLYNYVTRGEQP
jgi:tetratricopeptide (TPR) repeat protein